MGNYKSKHIGNFEIKKLKKLRYYSKSKIMKKEKRKRILTEDLEIHIIEIQKIYEIENKEQGKECVN